MAFYDEALARIQASDFGGVAEDAALGIVRHVQRAGFRGSNVVDLGCGAGPLAKAMGQAGFNVYGIEGSRALARLAKARAPGAHIEVGDVHKVAWHSPQNACAVLAVGEVLQYMPPSGRVPSLPHLLARAYQKLLPGGLVMFDLITEPLEESPQTYQATGQDWEITINAEQVGAVLRRELLITRQRQLSREVHCQYIWSEAQILTWMQQARFNAKAQNTYGAVPIFPRRKVFIGSKIG